MAPKPKFARELSANVERLREAFARSTIPHVVGSPAHAELRARKKAKNPQGRG